MVSWKKISEDYKIQKEEKVDYFFDDQRDDLESILNSHAVWTDALENIKLRNEKWLNDNATGYIVGHPSYNVDFIYIANATETFSML